MSNTYYENNKEAIIERNKQYYRANIDDKTKYNHEYYEKHKCALKENRSTCFYFLLERIYAFHNTHDYISFYHLY
jgi:hypothetical protein